MKVMGVYNENMNIELFFNQYLKSVYNYVFRIIPDKNEAEDITQEVFVKVWKNLGKVDPDKNFKTWIFAITRNTTIDWLRKRKNIHFSEEEDFEENIPDIEPLPDEIFERKELGKELGGALLKIRPDFREIILLRYTEDFTFEEIAEITGKPLNTVKSHHHRALSALRKLLIGPATK
jgi:RNA polymerase sigma-70 factor, ECF subfamily